MDALTLWQPWAWAMCHGKEVENRSWWPPTKALGTWVALHAATRPQPIQVEHGMLEGLGRLRVGALPRQPMPLPGELVRGAFVAIGFLMGAVEFRDMTGHIAFDPGTTELLPHAIVMVRDKALVNKVEEIARASRYTERGKVNWVFRPIAVLKEFVPYRRGLQRLWKVPPEMEGRILRQVDSSVVRMVLGPE